MEIEGRSNQLSRNLTHLMRSTIQHLRKLYPRGIQFLNQTKTTISNRLLIPNENNNLDQTSQPQKFGGNQIIIGL